MRVNVQRFCHGRLATYIRAMAMNLASLRDRPHGRQAGHIIQVPGKEELLRRKEKGRNLINFFFPPTSVSNLFDPWSFGGKSGHSRLSSFHPAIHS